jgi:hypothetical protein
MDCTFDNGDVLTATLDGDTLTFFGGMKWSRYGGLLSGLWYGPSDSADYTVVGHNSTDGTLVVWWDTNISTALWHYGEGTVAGVVVSLLIPDYSANKLVGNLSTDGTTIDWVGGAGVWHRHPSQCLVDACIPIACSARSLNNPYSELLQCPSEAEITTFTAAAERGDIAWHAGPFNWQPENMSPALFDSGIDIVRRMDERFYKGAKNTTTMSVR